MGKFTWCGLLIIVALAFILRFYQATQVPPALNWDEVAIGYNANSILKTGRDEWNQPWPIHFKSYGEYKLGAQVYASIPGIAIFGLNELGVRVTPVVYGTLTVLFLFFLTRRLTKNNQIALLSAAMLAISPWHIHLTRASFESSFSVMWVIVGVWFFLKGLEDRKWLIISVIPFAISIYTYNSARVFTPLFLLALLFLYKDQLLKYKKTLVISFAVFALLMLPFAQFVMSGEGNSRYKLVSVTDDAGLIPRIDEQRNLTNLPSPIKELIHNRYSYVSFYVIRNYLSHFSPNFLFISGAPHKQHHVQGVGEMYLFQAPFVLLGLWWLFRSKQKYRWLISIWILLTFIPVSITNDSIPHALRTLIAAPAYQILTALGIYRALVSLGGRSQKIFLAGGLTVIVLVSMGLYLNNYFNQYSSLYSRDWQYGQKEAVEYIKENQDKYDQIVFTRHYGEPHMFTLFYLNLNPAKYQTDKNLERFETFDWVRVIKFDKYYFPDLGDQGTQFQDIVNANPEKKILFIGKPGDFPKDVHKLKTINFLDGQPAFEIVEKL